MNTFYNSVAKLAAEWPGVAAGSEPPEPVVDGDARDKWLRACPFMDELMSAVADMVPDHGGDCSAVFRTAAFAARAAVLCLETPGGAEWLRKMPNG